MLNSRLTLRELLNRTARKIGEPVSNLDTELALDAINQALRIYYDSLRQYEPERLKRVVSVIVPETGFDLRNITLDHIDVNGVVTQRPAIGIYHTMTVWDERDRIMTRVQTNGLQYGYYILGDVMFLTGGQDNITADVLIEYDEVTPRISTDDEGFDYDTTILPVDQDIETAFEEYIIAYYKRSDGVDDGGALSYQHAIDRFQQDLARLFRYRMKPLVIRQPQFRGRSTRRRTGTFESSAAPIATQSFIEEVFNAIATPANTDASFTLSNSVDVTYPPIITVNGLRVDPSDVVSFSGTTLTINVDYILNDLDRVVVIYRF